MNLGVVAISNIKSTDYQKRGQKFNANYWFDQKKSEHCKT